MQETNLRMLCPSPLNTTSFTKELWPLNSFSVLPDFNPCILQEFNQNIKTEHKNNNNFNLTQNTKNINKLFYNNLYSWAFAAGVNNIF